MELFCVTRCCCRATKTWKTLIHAVVFLVCIQRTWSQGSSPEVNASVGATVTLPAPVTANIDTFTWYRGTAGIAAQRIFTYKPSTSTQGNGPQHTGREVGLADGSLQIRDARTSDTGNYTVSMILNDLSAPQQTTQLRVYEDVTKPIMNYVSTQLVENRGPANITCETSNAETILWLFNNSTVLPSNIMLSAYNRTLSIKNVTRDDTGTYQCEGINPVSRSKSDPKMLTVAYGPENIMIDPAGSQLLPVGAKLSLKCTALSVPGASYQWLLNDNDLKQPGSTFTIAKVSSKDNGNYTCEAQNPVSQLSVKATVSIYVNGTDPGNGDNGPPVGVIVGAVIGALVLGAIAGALVYFFVFKKPVSGAPTSNNSMDAANSTKPASTNAKAAGNGEELQYSSVNFVPKPGIPMKPITTDTTVYSEVRRQ